MAKRTKVVRTIHYAEIAASLEAQNRAVMNLLQMVKTTLSMVGDKIPTPLREQLDKAANETSNAMWPSDEDDGGI